MLGPFPDASALVAKLVAAFASDVVASFIFLYDEVAVGALNVVEFVLQEDDWLFLALAPVVFEEAFGAVFLGTSVTEAGFLFGVDKPCAGFFGTEFEVGVFWDEVESLDFLVFEFGLRGERNVKFGFLVDLGSAFLIEAFDSLEGADFGVEVWSDTLSTTDVFAMA